MKPEEVARVWDVGAVQAVRPLGGGSINGAWRVLTAAGAFHLRVYRSPDRARAGREHGAIAAAVAAGVPTPEPLPTRSGGALGQIGGELAALFPLAPGAPVPRRALTPAYAAALGTFLAELHDRLPPAVPFEVPQLRASSIERTVERLERVEAALLALPAPDEVDSWALARTRQRLAHLRASPLPDHQPAFPHRFLHGDYHDGNVFFVGTRPAALIDWEQTRLAPRAWEIVRCLDLSLKLDPALSTAFLKGYRERLPLSADELADGGAFYAFLQERNVWTYESVYIEGNPGPRRFIGPPPYVPFQVRWAALT
ncbi:phosphotransferase [Deinococcus metallilatus]|uniref:Homoserine kinase type II n=1 Tax=Deinococcus metallilatus TaxID=1211322 RepID=A0ABR6MXA3_9DEIO|nr:phosphotransferase [Deinococcus metallilatus]MBB5296569.1 homoserine kinase type II [Deinococcus metallilatus]GMA17486.1 hypothetical protein GCM10025871_38170 [Deinococcus metallilatus]